MHSSLLPLTDLRIISHKVSDVKALILWINNVQDIL